MKFAQMLLCSTICLAVVLVWDATIPAQEKTGDELVQLVVTLLSDPDRDMRALGLEQIRTGAKGALATRQFAAQLPNLPPDVQASLLNALVDRGDTAARPAIVDLLAASRDEPVRIAAIRALGFLGTSTDLELLMPSLIGGTAAEQATTRTSLARLPGESVSKALAAQMRRADPPLRVTLIEILATRRAFETAVDLLPAAVDPDVSVRSAAMAALAQLAGPEHMAGMVRGILAAQPGRERDAAEKAVMQVCGRIKDPQEQAVPLLAVLHTLDEADQIALLPALGRIGGNAAREIVQSAIDAPDPTRREAGLRALCNWPNASVASELIQRVQKEEDSGNRITALRALIRVAPLPDGRSDSEKLELLQKAMSLCTRDTERNLVLQRAQAIRCPETLHFLMEYLDQPAYSQQVCQSVVELAHHRQLRESNKAEFTQALGKVIEISQDTTVIDRAKRYLKGQTWVRPK